MSQYREGTIDVTNNDQTIVGTDVDFVSEVNPGDMLTVVGSNVWYEVASITDATHLELSAMYAGATQTGQYYVILRDFTVDGIPYPQQGDIETASIMKRAIFKIQELITALQ